MSQGQSERCNPNDFYPKGYTPVKIKTALEYIGLDAGEVRAVYRDSYYMAMWCKKEGLCKRRLRVKDALVLAAFGYAFRDPSLYEKTPQFLLNQSLYFRTAEDMEDIKDFLFLVLRSLRHLEPVTKTQLYFASDECVKVDSEHYVVGEMIVWPIFTSTTTDMTSLLPGLTSADGTTRGTLFIIDNAVGYDIQPYVIPRPGAGADAGASDKAPKIILDPDTTFVVRRAIPGNLTIIALEAVKPKTLFLAKAFSRFNSQASKSRTWNGSATTTTTTTSNNNNNNNNNGGGGSGGSGNVKVKGLMIVPPVQDDNNDIMNEKDEDDGSTNPQPTPRQLQTQLRISHRRTLSDSSCKGKIPLPPTLSAVVTSGLTASKGSKGGSLGSSPPSAPSGYKKTSLSESVSVETTEESDGSTSSSSSDSDDDNGDDDERTSSSSSASSSGSSSSSSSDTGSSYATSEGSSSSGSTSTSASSSTSSSSSATLSSSSSGSDDNDDDGDDDNSSVSDDRAKRKKEITKEEKDLYTLNDMMYNELYENGGLAFHLKFMYPQIITNRRM